VCEDFDSDQESDFSDDDTDDEAVVEEFKVCRVRPHAERAKRLTREDTKNLIGRCGIMDVNCIQHAKEVSNPLLSNAVESGLFCEDALDFLNLTLQWTVCLIFG
jgi:hypothetical protein